MECDICHKPKAQWITKDLKMCIKCIIEIQKEKYENREYGIK